MTKLGGWAKRMSKKNLPIDSCSFPKNNVTWKVKAASKTSHNFLKISGLQVRKERWFFKFTLIFVVCEVLNLCCNLKRHLSSFSNQNSNIWFVFDFFHCFAQPNHTSTHTCTLAPRLEASRRIHWLATNNNFWGAQSNKAIIKLVVMLIPVLSELDENLSWYLDSTFGLV